MTNDQAIRYILEGDERVLHSVCGYCEKELGTTPNRDESHGICKRHQMEMSRILLRAAVQSGNPDNIKLRQDYISKLRNTPESDFPCQDLVAQSRQIATAQAPQRPPPSATA